MKKLFTLTLGVALCATVNAESVKILGLGGIPGWDEPQFMGLGISADGKYVCGSIEMGDGFFVADIQNDVYQFEPTDDPEGAELRHVDNNGLAIGYNGPGVTYNINGEQTVLVAPDGDYKYVLGEDISNDGSIMVGSAVAKGYATYAAFSKDGGQWQLLPEGTEEQLGEYAGEGSSAKYVSGDGKVILGCIGNFGPGVIWEMNDEGEYVLDPIYTKYVILSEEDLENPDKKLYDLFAMGLSNNGKYALFRGLVMSNDGERQFVPVVYNTEEKSLLIYDDPQEIDMMGMGLTPSAIDDNGTIVGIIGMPLTGSAGSFVLKAGESQAEPMAEVYPEFGALFGFADMIGYCQPTGMSADGRYIVGYGFYCEDFEDDEAPAYFVTYVIDTQNPGTGVQIVDKEAVEATPEAIYSIDGKRLDNMVKGLNIIRMSDGSVRKIFK